MPHPVLESASRFRAQLLAQERQAATRLVEAYGRAYTSTQAAARALANEVAMISQQGGTVAEASIRRLASLQSLQRQIVDQVERYAVYADREIVAGVERAIELGVRGSRDTVLASFTGSGQVAAMRARWDMLPAESIETMLGFTAEGSPLRSRLVGVLGEAVAQRAGDALVQGIATGMGPRAVADVLRREMGAGLTWSLTTARTAQLWAYRDATRLNYMRNSDIVTGWKWLSAADGRTCMSCWAQHGSVHSVNEILADHHNGRCTQVPIVPLAQRLGLSEPDVGNGETKFAALPEADQRAAMGPAMFEAWKNGDFRFADLSRPYTDPVYGTMLGQASLKDLVGADRAKGFTTFVMGRGARPGTLIQDTALRPIGGKPKAIMATDSARIEMVGTPLQKDIMKRAEDALETIGQVHGYIDAPLDHQIIMIENRSDAVFGYFNLEANRLSASRKIPSVVLNPAFLKDKVEHVGGTVVHEMGHWLDYHVLGKGKFASSTRIPEMGNLWGAITRSKRYQQWTEQLAAAPRGSKKYMQYLMSDHEVFARSYTQMIAQRTNNSSILDYIADDLNDSSDIKLQWDADDFVEINQAFGDFLKMIGLAE